MLKEIFVDINDYNKSFITATESDNNSDVYKIIITEDGRRFDLTDKTVQMAYAISYTDKGDILNLNVTNPTEGEITLEITNELTRKDGDYTCQLLILGENEYRRHSKYYFNLSIRENLFNKISGEIIESPNIGILQELVKKAEFLNTQLENKNKVAENLNSNLNENISVADPLNNSLSEKIPEAATKKSQLEKSITKAKEFIDGLDGSQNIPGIRMELTELQNGLKSNQALAYQGSSITANDTLEGRTEVMKITGLTLQNLFAQEGYYVNPNGSQQYFHSRKYKNLFKAGKYTLKNITGNALIWDISRKDNDEWVKSIKSNKSIVIELEEGQYVRNIQALTINGWILNESTRKILEHNVVILEGDRLDIIDSIDYFEGIKSFGEEEQERDKYKISILSSGKNFFKSYKSKSKGNTSIFNIENDNVTIGTNQSLSWINASINYGKLKIGSKYTVSCEGFSGGVGDKVLFAVKKYKGRDEVGAYGDINKNSLSLTFTVVDDADIVLKFFVNNTTPINTPTSITYNNIQIVEGIKTNYAPSIIDKKDILILAPLRSVYDVQDIMYEENGQVKVTRNIDTYIFTGDETMRDTTEQDEKSGTGKYKVFALTVNKTIYINKNINNNFPKKQFNVAFQNMDSEGLAVTQYGVYIKILKSKLSTQDAEGFKAWLKANTTTIYFARATPVTEIVENCIDIDLDTYQEKTYFNILNSLPGTLDFKVPSNIGSVVQNMAKEVNNIWDVINNLLVPSIVKANGNLAMLKLNNNLN